MKFQLKHAKTLTVVQRIVVSTCKKMRISSITATVTISRSKSHCKPLAFRAIGFIGLVRPENILIMGHIKVAHEHHVVPYPIVKARLEGDVGEPNRNSSL